MMRPTLAQFRIIWFLLIGPVALCAAPRLILDSMLYHAGTIDEGKNLLIRHSFNLKNAGNETLVISKIKTYCGCTSYSADTVIPAGGAGRIVEEVDLREVHTSDFHKALVLWTNDPLYPRAEIAIDGKIKFLIEAAPVSVVLPTTGNKDTVQEVTLKTARSDLRVSRVAFVMTNSPSPWETTLPLKFVFRKTGQKDAGGIYVYSLKIYYGRVDKERRYGSFVITTDHPQKPEVKITGLLEPL